MTSYAPRKYQVSNGKRKFVIAMREPWDLPRNEIELPLPEKIPNPPPQMNILTLVLPPVVMIGGTVIFSLISGKANLVLIAPMMIMSLGYPIANIINLKVQAKNYKKKIQQRGKNYVARLKAEMSNVDKLVDKQRSILEQEFPSFPHLKEIGLSLGNSPRLWWRRVHDSDFLCFRVGTSKDVPSFSILPPKMIIQDDPLINLPWEFIDQYKEIDKVPMMVDMKRAGSLVISADSAQIRLEMAYRLLADLFVHHSPDDIDIALLADYPNSDSVWNWLKWAPHAHTFLDDHGRSIAFTDDDINNVLFSIRKIFEQRLEEVKKYDSNAGAIAPALFILIDDVGRVRQLPEISKMAALGYTVGIYLIFLGGQNTPNTCRARLEINRNGQVKYLETWEAQGKGGEKIGTIELANQEALEEISRALAGLEVAGGKSSTVLPSNIRISKILGDDPLSLETITENWSRSIPEMEQVLLPVGQFVERTGLSTFDIDFRPESLGGVGEYHALLIGTTGSGKSIFLQSMVLAAAHKYSPKHLNFLFMDFKAGAAELNKIKDLPHVVGMINDLSPALAERALQALENELSHRQLSFDQFGKVTDVWDYNRRNPENAIPHLLVVIDEFAEGIKILPNLVERLRDLGRRGRAFGMYFVLANQEVNSAVDSLKSNVGWYVVLKVKRMEEMSLIDKNLKIAPGHGRGYIRVKSDIISFQGAYAGMPILSANQVDCNEYSIYKIDADGRRTKLYEHKPISNTQSKKQNSAITEQELLVSLMREAAATSNIESAKPIYIDPLPSIIHLNDVIEATASYRRFNGMVWGIKEDPLHRLIAIIGYLDLPDSCLQPVMEVDFNEADGHLWVVGNPGSGVNNVLQTILISLSLTHQPDEIQFYIIDFGGNSFKTYESLPHVGAVIRSPEKERLERLLRYLDDELERRNKDDWHKNENADIIIMINNFAEFQVEYPDYIDSITKYIRAGKEAGIHIIISTNRGGELNRKISSNITRRIVLKLSTRDEYMDIIGQVVPPISEEALARGYWVGSRIAICQVASPEILLSDLNSEMTVKVGRNKKVQEKEESIEQVIERMKIGWDGALPKPIETLSDQIPFSNIVEKMVSNEMEENNILAPVGIEYESLELIKVNLQEEIPNWLILGPRQSGKTNFLFSFAFAMNYFYPNQIEIKIITLRRNFLSKLLDSDSGISILNDMDDILEEIKNLNERPIENNAKHYMLLIDDLGAAFEPGKEKIVSALNDLAIKLSTFSDVYVVITALREELQSQFSSSFVKLFKQSRTGITFSTDATDLDWLGAQVSLRQRKMSMPAGRGFFISKGKVQFVQIPWMDNGRQILGE